MDLFSRLILFLSIKTFFSNGSVVRMQQTQGFNSARDFMLKMGSKIKSTEDFLKYVDSNITVEHVSEDEDRILVGGSEVRKNITVYNWCSPKYVNYPVPPDPEPNVLIWPPCTRVKRCGGCAMNPRLTCVASKIETKSFTVLKTRIYSPGDVHPNSIQFKTYLYESEEECEARCLRSQNDCNSFQYFSYYECGCVCANYGTKCESGKYFDTDDCMCKCVDVIKCPGNHSVFDHGGCECRPMNTKELLLSGGIDENELTEFLNAKRNRTLSNTTQSMNLTTSSQTTETASNTAGTTVAKNVTDGNQAQNLQLVSSSTTATSATTTTTTASTTPPTTTTKSPVTSKPPTLGGGICGNCQGRAIPLPTGTCLCLPPIHTTTTLRPSCPKLPCPHNWSVGRLGGRCLCVPLGLRRRRRSAQTIRRPVWRPWRQMNRDIE